MDLKMNTQELYDALKGIGANLSLVVLGGDAEEAFCLNQADDGKWEFYWKERGKKHDLKRFDNETIACFYLFGQFSYKKYFGRNTYPAG